MVFTEASLSDSLMFQNLNNSASLVKKVKAAMETGVTLDKSYIEEQYLQIEKTKLSPMYDRVLHAFDAGQVKLIYNKSKHVTTALPFICLSLGGKLTACIFVADFGPMNKEGTQLSMDMKKLYTLMESAYVGLRYFTDPSAFIKNGGFAKTIATIYSEMTLQILNRDYALSLNKPVYDTVNYMTARFCIGNVLGMKSQDLVKSYAEACCKKIDQTTVTMANVQYERSEVKTCEDLIKLIASTEPKMANLSFRYYFERWISSFGTGACLSVDTFPYLYYVIVNVLLSGFLINVSRLSEIVKNTKGIGSFYADISRMI